MLNQKRRRVEDTISLLVFRELKTARLRKRERRLVRALIAQSTERSFYVITQSSVSIDFACRRLLGRGEPSIFGPPDPNEVEVLEKRLFEKVEEIVCEATRLLVPTVKWHLTLKKGIAAAREQGFVLVELDRFQARMRDNALQRDLTDAEREGYLQAVGDLPIVSNELQLDFDPLSQNLVPTKTPYIRRAKNA